MSTSRTSTPSRPSASGLRPPSSSTSSSGIPSANRSAKSPSVSSATKGSSSSSPAKPAKKPDEESNEADDVSMDSSSTTDLSPRSRTSSVASTVSTTSSADRRFSLLDHKSDTVKVCVRVRPMNQMEKKSKQQEAWNYRNDSIIFQVWSPPDTSAAAASNTKKAANAGAYYVFDKVFTEDKANYDVYDAVGRPVVESAMKGFHGCIFAYGQTSSGKTHTIHGTKTDPGMIPHSLETVFDWIETCADREFVLRVSYLEIYNEIINDLLDPLNSNLQIREDKKKGVYCDRLKEDIVVSASQVFSLLSAGESQRHVGKTNYNEQSSRSHTIFRIVVESSQRGAGAAVRCSALNLVDLAGSENAVKAGSASRVKETGYINRSLLTLGHVIYKLSEISGSNQHVHIPYRDSKLTRILQSSLGGNSLVSVVCAISPASGNLEETISTLKFANRAKKVKSNASVNESMDESTLLKQYKEEIDRLKDELKKAKEQNQLLAKDPAKNEAKMESENETAALSVQIDQLTRLILKSSMVEDEEGNQVPASSLAAGLLAPPIIEKTKAQNFFDSASSPFQNIKSPTGRRKTSRTRDNPYNTLELPHSVMRRRSMSAVVTEDDVQAINDVKDTDENKEEGSSGGAADPNVPAHLANMSTAALRERVLQLEGLLDTEVKAKEELQARIREQEQALEEWQNYYISIKNKLEASEAHTQNSAAAVAGNESFSQEDATQTMADHAQNVPGGGEKNVSELEELQNLLDSNDFAQPLIPIQPK